MEVEQVADGLWQWTGYHEEWKQEVGCTYVETTDGVCLVDPLVPPEDRAKFLEALDRDVARLGLPVHVLVTVFWHTRDAAEVAERYGASIWAPSRARAAVERRAGGAVRAFRPGDGLPGGIEAHATARSNEVVLFLPQHGALVAGDVILGTEDGSLRLCPDSWLPDGVDREALRINLLPLLKLPVEHVLVSHGHSVLDTGGEALRGMLEP